MKLLASTISCGLDGVNGFVVKVEAFLANGLPGFEIVGLPSAAVKESRDRIKAALQVAGYPWPMQKVTVNLSPADVKKEGTGFELAIAMAILAAYRAGDRAEASRLSAPFLHFERVRAAINGFSVMHDAVTLSGIADMGPILPMAGNVAEVDRPKVREAVAALVALDKTCQKSASIDIDQ